MTGTLGVRQTSERTASSGVGLRQGTSSRSTAEMTGSLMSAKLTSDGVIGETTGGAMIAGAAGGRKTGEMTGGAMTGEMAGMGLGAWRAWRAAIGSGRGTTVPERRPPWSGSLTRVRPWFKECSLLTLVSRFLVVLIVRRTSSRIIHQSMVLAFSFFVACSLLRIAILSAI